MLKKLIFMFSLLPVILFAQDKKIDTAASDWLSLVDNEHYSESWDNSGEFFRQQISQADWVEAVSVARKSVGNFESRKLSNSQLMTSLPNVPEGEYAVFQYQSVFSGMKKTETLSLTKDSDGWRVIGYFIK